MSLVKSKPSVLHAYSLMHILLAVYLRVSLTFTGVDTSFAAGASDSSATQLDGDAPQRLLQRPVPARLPVSRRPRRHHHRQCARRPPGGVGDRADGAPERAVV